MKLISEISFFKFINNSDSSNNGEFESTSQEYRETIIEESHITKSLEEGEEEIVENENEIENEKEISETIIINESIEIVKLCGNNNNDDSKKSSNKKSKKKRKLYENNNNNKVVEVEYKKGYFINSRGMKLVCQEWIPKNPRGIVIVLHGYGDHGQTTLAEDCKIMARNGFASFIYDQQGHGLSEGVPAYIRDFDDLVEDSLLFISDIKFRFPTLKRFVCCTSMGGAVGTLVSLRKPDVFDGGLILLAPLIKLDENMIPNPILVSLLTWVSKSFPTLAIVPGENVLDRSIKDPQKRVEHANHPLTYKGRARIGTGLAILKATSFLQSHLEDISVPLLILHGSLDRVSSPTVSEELYKKAMSSDKTLKLYPTFWHGITSEKDADIVYNDIINWMIERLNPKNDSVGSANF
ncbi:hypothetical protein RB653_002631 [Dictyostelium firmibasis]|uniref:Serine aminopeptidase S33 domain-containing protein n=1 Tax=Dictyostelium firmibasis TaxID=79012 RepID=A0AAN7YSX1_9MYCE